MKLLEYRFGYALSIFVFVVSAFAFWQARELQPVSAWFPVFVSAAAALVVVVVMAADVLIDRRARRLGTAVPATVPAAAGTLPVDQAEEEDTTPAALVMVGFAKYFLWFIGFAVLFLLVGMPLSVLLWTLGFIRIASRDSWLRAGISAVAITVGLIMLAAILALGLPEGWLVDSNIVIPNWRL